MPTYNRTGQSNTNTIYKNDCQRQHSFDDTESQNYFNLYHCTQPSTMRYENIYEQIRDEPIYRNTNGSRVYGRLNVIGHGIGRIERHLSSSCGNIDHYNLGGHYAVLGHSHFGTMGHIRVNATANTGYSIGASSNNCGTGNNITNFFNAGIGVSAVQGNCSTASKESTNVKNSSSFFSCLHGDNTQSMSNIYKTSINGNQSPTSAMPEQKHSGIIYIKY